MNHIDLIRRKNNNNLFIELDLTFISSSLNFNIFNVQKIRVYIKTIIV